VHLTTAVGHSVVLLQDVPARRLVNLMAKVLGARNCVHVLLEVAVLHLENGHDDGDDDEGE